jgi:hypothetical protein
MLWLIVRNSLVTQDMCDAIEEVSRKPRSL